ncbi:Hypothetical protein NTJ_06048 [Nesidiocoris tenuis]|uniref:Uncharacterized protein n=1 Tax=Nesidiocoris tenuis TaxID=355587 RepID=A0ABN7APN2_9HEMI|nr:Hypothetical protein NTJ_06048 [Nesidiocoris tenuis]
MSIQLSSDMEFVAEQENRPESFESYQSHRRLSSCPNFLACLAKTRCQLKNVNRCSLCSTLVVADKSCSPRIHRNPYLLPTLLGIPYAGKETFEGEPHTVGKLRLNRLGDIYPSCYNFPENSSGRTQYVESTLSMLSSQKWAV